MQIQISWLLKKPTDLDLHFLHRQDISGLSRITVKEEKENGKTKLNKKYRFKEKKRKKEKTVKKVKKKIDNNKKK